MNMVKLYDGGVYLVNGTEIVPEAAAPETYQKDTAKQGTIAYTILKAHNTAEDMQNLRLKFDALASHDITFVGIIQTARASGMEKFPIPYVLTNCHNSLCAAGGTYTNVMAAAHILKGAQCGQGEFTLDVYPSSQPVFMDLLAKGAISDLMATGAIVKTAFCGPCFGAGDTPANNALSIRHATRNFPNREGSKPGAGQLSAVALMDARSIAATAANGGILTSAEKYADDYEVPEYNYDDSSYRARIYNGFGKAEPEDKLIYGPNIKDWPEQEALAQNILLRVCSKIMDKVTTTDELIPSGETSSYRSNPLGLAEFTLSRRDPGYVQRAKDVRALEKARLAGEAQSDEALKNALGKVKNILPDVDEKTIEIGSVIYCVKPGDGSAREQAASCQRVLGGLANICSEYATKRYRSNVMNWGMLPFQMKNEPAFEIGDYILVPTVLDAMDGDMQSSKAYVLGDEVKEIELYIAPMTEDEKKIVKAGCLINFNRKN